MTRSRASVHRIRRVGSSSDGASVFFEPAATFLLGFVPSLPAGPDTHPSRGNPHHHTGHLALAAGGRHTHTLNTNFRPVLLLPFPRLANESRINSGRQPRAPLQVSSCRFVFALLSFPMPPWTTVAALFRALLVAAVAATATEALSLDVHHRYSAAVRARTGHSAPASGTAEYYAALAGHDLRRRSLASAGAGGQVTFADGNDTYRLNDFGFLHYAVVALGTPNVTFLVALDTGSDLFWVPCDCVKCAPLTSPSYGDLKFDVYSPQKSSTSRKVPCSSNLCEFQSACGSASNTCPYSIEYLSDNTSSSGVLVEDVLYMITESAQPKIVTVPISFGCGQIQTGSFLGSAAPNGLLGLGMASRSVPSSLASKGIAANSFSMCFGKDGHGRINFGDMGSSDQQETPLNIYKQNPFYNISITGAMVGSKSISTKFNAIVDTGTSFTALSDPMYTEITNSFNSQVQDKPSQLDSNLPFEYCYIVSAKGPSDTPNISLTAKGGSIFPVNDPIIIIADTTSTAIGYCLAIMKSEGVNLIGENFMSGLKIVFDRERMVLGWKFFDCYSEDSSSKLPVNPNPSAVPSRPAPGPNSYTPEAAKGAAPNCTQVNSLEPSASYSQQELFSANVFIATALLFALII